MAIPIETKIVQHNFMSCKIKGESALIKRDLHGREPDRSQLPTLLRLIRYIKEIT